MVSSAPRTERHMCKERAAALFISEMNGHRNGGGSSQRQPQEPSKGDYVVEVNTDIEWNTT